MTPQQIDTILYRLDRQDKALDRIEAHVQQTNGRVTKLERDAEVGVALAKQAERLATRRATRQAWLVPALTGMGATVGATVLAHFL